MMVDGWRSRPQWAALQLRCLACSPKSLSPGGLRGNQDLQALAVPGSPTGAPLPRSEGWEGRVQVMVAHREAIIFLWQDESSSSCQFYYQSCRLVGRAGKGWEVHGQNKSAQGVLLPLRQLPLWVKEALVHDTP